MLSQTALWVPHSCQVTDASEQSQRVFWGHLCLKREIRRRKRRRRGRGRRRRRRRKKKKEEEEEQICCRDRTEKDNGPSIGKPQHLRRSWKKE